jgi:hypothetical protein
MIERLAREIDGNQHESDDFRRLALENDRDDRANRRNERQAQI